MSGLLSLASVEIEDRVPPMKRVEVTVLLSERITALAPLINTKSVMIIFL